MIQSISFHREPAQRGCALSEVKEHHTLTASRSSTRAQLLWALSILFFLANPATAQSVQQAYALLVRAQILEQPYPEAETWETGAARLAFEIDVDGRITSVSVKRSSGSKQVDKSAIAMVRAASPFSPPPDGAPQAFTIEIQAMKLREPPKASAIEEPKR
ncbi:MAG: energy transducer TonB [Pseudomonadota bacterium]